jgi:ATP-dependent DNA helicase RecQ
MHLARQLVQMGYLIQESEYRTLSLSPKASESLKNRTPILGQLQEADERASRKAEKIELEYNQAMFALLRAKRKELADEAGVPPYVIFADRTLVEIAAYAPQSAERLLDISGVGQVKARRYGEAFLEIVRAYCQKHNLPEKIKKTGRAKDDSGRRYVMVAEAFNAGESVTALMVRYQVTAGTILDHLARYAAAGHKLRRAEELLALSSASPDQQEAAFAAFDELGTAFLKPVFDKLNETLDYNELKILRICYLNQNE